MINNQTLNKMIVYINDIIHLYALKADVYKQTIYNDLNIKTKITNERTLAIFLSKEINKYFTLHKYDVKIQIDEFKIKTNKFNNAVISKLNNEVDNKSSKKIWNDWMYVDSYFLVNNLYYTDLNHLFIEYKLENKFVFTKLAQDYLKFKFYTANNDLNSIFVYTIVSKKEMYPSILSKKIINIY